MKCTNCGGNTKVVDTANVSKNKIYRRRRCVNCGSIMYTAENEVERDNAFAREWSNARTHMGKLGRAFETFSFGTNVAKEKIDKLTEKIKNFI